MSRFRGGGRGGRSWGNGVKREIHKPERYPKHSTPFPKLKDVWRGSENQESEMELAACHAEYEFNRRNSLLRLVFCDNELIDQVDTSEGPSGSSVSSSLVDVIIKSDSSQFPVELHDRKPRRQISRKKKKKRKIVEEALDSLKRSGSETAGDGGSAQGVSGPGALGPPRTKSGNANLDNDDDEGREDSGAEMAESDIDDDFRHEVDDDDQYGDASDGGDYEATCQRTQNDEFRSIDTLSPL